MAKKFVVVDLETTGNSPKKGDRIIQIAAVVIEGGKISDTYTSLLNPLQPIPPFISELTGLSDDDVSEAPLFSEIAPKISSLLKDAYFVAHNVLFDLGFLQEELILCGEESFAGPVLDTVEMARFLKPSADSYKLADLAAGEGLSHDRPHQADSDATVTAELFLLFLDKLKKLPEKTLGQLALLSEGLKSDIHLLLHSIGSIKVTDRGTLPDSIVYVNGLAIKKQERQMGDKTSTEASLEYPWSDSDKQKFFSQSPYRLVKREGQFEMMDEVFHSFQNGTHALIEAGTGIGKSLGYLFPAVYFSRLHAVRVIISTYTIQLQEQLLAKEIPLLSGMVPFSFKSAMLKGKNNYISLSRFAKSLEEENDNYDIVLAKMQILIWLLDTDHGDRDELNLSSGGQLYWNTIRNEKGILREQDPWHEHDFYNKARKKADEADILITNHSLLLSDVESGGNVLPAYSFAILDEGHHFEKASAGHLGIRLDYLSIRLALNQFGLYEQRQLFYKTVSALSQFQNGKKMQIQHINDLFADTLYDLDEFFKISIAYASKAAKKNSSKKLKAVIYRHEHNREWQALNNASERLIFRLRDLSGIVQSMYDKAIVLPGRSSATLGTELAAYKEELEGLRAKFTGVFTSGDEFVKWVETDLRVPQNATEIFAMPVTVSETLSKKFFSLKKSVVLTSATLTVNQSFSYMIEALGLEPRYVNTISIPSPFNYKDNVKLFISSDVPEINSVSQDSYIAEVSARIISICEAAKGRLLVLFTSHDMLKKTFELVKESGLLPEYALIAQGITGGSRSRLTRNFQKYDKAVLFGTNSFWEGVDIPGEGLSCLIVVRLPFSSPDEPLTKAKCEQIEKNGGRPFSEYSLPEAVLRFKQGFGRLIRTDEDRGVIVIFDKRIGASSYGKVFLQSIPEIPIKKADIEELVNEIEKWL
ncbi:ATP-dependent DNA helicase DinG [Bacillus sp. B-jedd]|uniref:ATP-dependent DNA helicase DinG n=1 Tax=Bacillus sp. B-jedd TaxID=1476857 RepID=UPI0005156F92|nr:ATP-dependent DNA helicase DinG [Bacillus sp. B-jedd]CEG27628.1 DnaQ family exonuclease/DinG family helicase [Bacillus sp. B-jedd]